MKFVYPDIENVFDTDIDKVNSLIIENQNLMVSLLEDVNNLLQGKDGISVLSENDKELQFDKFAELIFQYVPFSINTKSLISKVSSAFEKNAMLDERYSQTMEMLGKIESYLFDLSQNFSGDFVFSKINISSLIKSVGIEFNEDYNSLGEKLVDYFELVTEYDKRKLFITLNLRDFINDKETELFIDTVLCHGYNLIMIDSHEHKLLKNENRIIVDDSLCIIK